MALTKINGGQIATDTAAVIDSLTFLDGESILRLPLGNTGNRPGSPSLGTIRFNTDTNNNAGAAEVYVANDGTGNPGWVAVGSGGASLGKGGVVRSNLPYIDENITIDPSLDEKFTNAFTRGPLEIRNGYTVTVNGDADWLLWGDEPDDPPVGSLLGMGYDQTPPTRYRINCNNLSDSNSTIPSLAVTYTPTRATSRIIITASISHNQHHVYSFGVKRNGTLMTSGAANSSNSNSQGGVMTGYKGHDDENYLGSDTFSFEDTTFTAGNTYTYEIAATASWSNSNRDLFINDRNSNDMRSISSMHVYEIMGS